MNKPFLSLRDSIQIVFTTLLSISTPLLAAGSAHAAGSNMPWEQPLQQVLQSVEGPVAKIIAVIIIITVQVAVDIELQEIDRRVPGSSRRFGRDTAKARSRKVQPVNERIDEPDRIVRADIVIDRLR
jgi:hypothetical protein